MSKTKHHRDVIKAETVITLHANNAGLNHDGKRAAIKAALLAATADLAETILSHQTPVLETGDGGAPPWGEVIIGPIWGERNPPEPPRPEFVREAGSPEFWKW